MKTKFKQLYMDFATRVAQLSRARRLQVGCVIVKDDRVISLGYNGTPAGWDNNCEDVVEQHEDGGQVLKTKPEVMHAERNAVDKLARSNESGLGADLFVTHVPCIECAKSIYGAGIKRVYYSNTYGTSAGVEFLLKSGVEVEQFDS
jgi:dCMP deaminase